MRAACVVLQVRGIPPRRLEHRRLGAQRELAPELLGSQGAPVTARLKEGCERCPACLFTVAKPGVDYVKCQTESG